MFHIFSFRSLPLAAVLGGICAAGCVVDNAPSFATEKNAAKAEKASASPSVEPVEEVVPDCPANCASQSDECSQLQRQCLGYDDSAAPLHVRIKTCTTTQAAYEHDGIECLLEPEYALVGGGAKTVVDEPPADPTARRSQFLTESHPLSDGRSWRASSRDPLADAPHHLVVYAIGMRLDGVNTQRLREAIKMKQVDVPGDTAALQVDAKSLLISGGAKTTPSPRGVDRFLTNTRFNNYHEWQAGSSGHPGEGTTSVWVLEIEDKIIEGFGALEIKQLIAPSAQQATGTSTSSVQIEPGWALVGMGGSVVSERGGAGRMLLSIAPGADHRSVAVSSSDNIESGAGTTTAYAIQARRVPASHGLCNPGSALLPQIDRCVSDICQQRSECCRNSWDESCVAMVETICQRSCSEHTCARTKFEPERWNYNFGTPDEPVYMDSGRNVGSNCANYALNKWGGFKMPGDSLNLLPDDEKISGEWDRQYALAVGEGLIPVSFDGTCTENRTKVYWGYMGGGDFHWRRQDVDGRWSEKMSAAGKVELSQSFVPGPGDGAHTYFCACNQPLPDTEPPFRP